MGRVFVVWMIAWARPRDLTWREASTLPIGSWRLGTSVGVLTDLFGCKNAPATYGAAAASPNSCRRPNSAIGRRIGSVGEDALNC
jgi:hypothetical protein